MPTYENSYPRFWASGALTTKLIGRYDNGTIFTNRGGGAVTYTLPAVADIQAGWHCWFFCVAAGDQVITAPAGLLVAFNNAAATTFTIGTNGEEIGTNCFVIFDGTQYLLALSLAAEAVTTAVA
jgi:hypothetical protein